MILKNIRLLSVAVLGAIVLAGCASMRTPMTDFATDYNRVIADTRNEMILLNIVRARYREPTHYSTLSQVSGNLSVGGSAGASLSGIIDDIDASASAGISVRSSPSFQIVPLNTRESANGILRPIEPNVVAIFLAQGWNENQLAALLIESVTCNGTTYHNDLRYDGGGDDTQRRLTRDQVFALGFASGAEATSNDTPLMSVQTTGEEALGYILDNLSDDYRVTLSPHNGERASFNITERVDQVLQVTTGSGGAADFCGGASLAPAHYELRSVEGVIYFLGEVLRTDGALRDDRGRTIFTVSNAPPSQGHAVRISHNGTSWFIARHIGQQDDRSIQVISLINQLINLQTSSDVLDRSSSTLTVN